MWTVWRSKRHALLHVNLLLTGITRSSPPQTKMEKRVKVRLIAVQTTVNVEPCQALPTLVTVMPVQKRRVLLLVLLAACWQQRF
jgi:hypothetical protein